MRPLLLLTIGLVIALLGTSCKKDASRSVRYAVDCDSCAVTYLTTSNQVVHDTAVLSWGTDFSSEKGQFVSVQASSLIPGKWVHASVAVYGGVVFDAGAHDTTGVAVASGQLP